MVIFPFQTTNQYNPNHQTFVSQQGIVPTDSESPELRPPAGRLLIVRHCSTPSGSGASCCFLVCDTYHYGWYVMTLSYPYYYWLVVSTPLKNISQLRLLFPISRKTKTVPNHQPDYCGWLQHCDFNGMITHHGFVRVHFFFATTAESCSHVLHIFRCSNSANGWLIHVDTFGSFSTLWWNISIEWIIELKKPL